jgi:RNA polymerase sigma-70 factor (ECF subfamily)
MHSLDDVVRAAARGDADAFGTLWTSLSPAIAAYFRAHAVDEAEDLTSEVFLAAFRAMATVTDGADQFRGLVFSIAHRRYVDWVRRRVRQGPLLPYEPELDTRCSTSAEDAAVARLGGRRALDLLGALTADQREVIALRVLGDLTLAQTAEVLGRDIGSVKSLQHRGLARLRRCLEEEKTKDVSPRPYPGGAPVRWEARHV